MRSAVLAALCTALLPAPLFAQWQMQTSNTSADLRGIANVGGGVAWASGTHGTVLRTEDGGYVWQTCAVPPGADKLDFRGVQAFDANTAIVMSSGPGDQSRLYKTTDGCHTWKLVFTNPDAPDGFFDAIVASRKSGLLVGDPVHGRFAIFASTDGALEKWDRFAEKSDHEHFTFNLKPYPGEGLFAASNSSAMGTPETGIAFATGGTLGAFFAYHIFTRAHGYPVLTTAKLDLPLAKGKSAGAFSFGCIPTKRRSRCVAVGGDYTLPDSGEGSAAYSTEPYKQWKPSRSDPHGYRSAVAYDATDKLWITVGPNGTDVSTDDGRNWRAVHPDKALGEADDADKDWNALSLPFVVGPHGRIGRLEPAGVGAGTRGQKGR